MTTNRAKEIAQIIVQGKVLTESIRLDVLAEINRELSSQVAVNRMKALVIIYGSNGNSAFIAYPLISKTRIRIVSDKRLTKEDLTLILHQPEVVGNVLPASLSERIKEDWKAFVVAGIIILIAFSILAFFSHTSSILYHEYLLDPASFPLVQNLISFYEIIGQSLLTIMTLFLTVFILFTISQNADIAKDKNLFIRGLFHKYVRDDQYITFASGISLLTASVGLLATSIPHELYSFSLQFQSIPVNKLNTLVPFLYSLSIATFYISLTSLSYYSERVITANESNLLLEIFDEREGIAAPQRELLVQQNNNGEKTTT